MTSSAIELLDGCFFQADIVGAASLLEEVTASTSDSTLNDSDLILGGGTGVVSREAFNDSRLNVFRLGGLTGALPPSSVMLASDSRLAVTLLRRRGLAGAASSSVTLTSDSLLENEVMLFRLGGRTGRPKMPLSCGMSQTSSEQTEDSRERLNDFLLGGRIGTPFSSTEMREL